MHYSTTEEYAALKEGTPYRSVSGGYVAVRWISHSVLQGLRPNALQSSSQSSAPAIGTPLTDLGIDSLTKLSSFIPVPPLASLCHKKGCSREQHHKSY